MSPSVSVSISLSRPVVYGMIRCKLSVYLTNAHSLPSIENSVLQYAKTKFLFHSPTVSLSLFHNMSLPLENPIL